MYQRIKKYDFSFTSIISLIGILLLLFLFVIPIFILFFEIIANTEKLLENVSFLINDPRVNNAFWFSFIQALISAVLSLIIGFPIAYIFSYYRFLGNKFLKSILTIPFLLPPIVVVQGFISVYGDSGLLNTIIMNFLPWIPEFNLFSVNGIILAHVFYNTPIIVRIISVSWEHLDKNPIEIAETLGSGRWNGFLKLELPQLRPAIISSFTLVFLYCFSSFAIVLSFGGLQIRTVEVQIFRFAKELPYLDYVLASTLSFIQLIFLFLAILLYYKMNRREIRQKKLGFLQKKNFQIFKISNILLIVWLMSYSIFMMLPMGYTILSAIISQTGEITLENFTLLFSNNFSPIIKTSFIRLIVNTLFIAFITIFLSIFMTLGVLLFLRYRKPISEWETDFDQSDWVQLILLGPLASSGLLIGLGLYNIFKATPLYGEFDVVIIIIAHSIAALPIVSRILITGFKKLDRNFSLVAATLGANKFQILYKIEFPLILKTFLVAGLFSFAISLGEFGSTLFINPSDFTTLSIAIYRILGSRNIGLASSMATVLIILCLLAFLFIELLDEKESAF